MNRLFAILLLCASTAGATDVRFTFANLLFSANSQVTNRAFRIDAAPKQFQANGTTLIVPERYSTNTFTGTIIVSNLTAYTYDCTITLGVNGERSFRILVPDSATIVDASSLITVDSTAQTYTTTAANARFVLRNNGWASNLVVTNLTMPQGAVSGYVWTATNANGRGEWQPGGSGGGSSTNGLATTNYVNNLLSTNGNTLWVDGLYGIDATGSTNNPARPFRSIGAAKTNAISGDVIIVRPSTYTEHDLAKNGVRYRFEDGAIVTWQDSGSGPGLGIFDDRATGAPGAFSVSGEGEFIYRGANPANGNSFGAIVITNAATVLHFKAKKIKVGTTVGALVSGITVLNCSNSFFHVDWITSTMEDWTTGDPEAPQSDLGNGIYWEKGEMHAEVNQIVTRVGYGIWANEPANAGEQNLYINNQYLFASNGVTFYVSSLTPSYRIWLTSQQIYADVFAVSCLGPAKIYVDAQKIFGNNIAVSSQSRLWLRAQKVSSPNQWVGLTGTNDSHITVQEYEDTSVGGIPAGIISSASSGTSFFHGGYLKGGTNAGALLAHGGAKTVAVGMVINATAGLNSTSYPISVSSNGLILHACSILSGPVATASINGNKIVEIVGGSYANRAISSSITQSNGWFQVSNSIYSQNLIQATAIRIPNAAGTPSAIASTNGGIGVYPTGGGHVLSQFNFDGEADLGYNGVGYAAQFFPDGTSWFGQGAATIVPLGGATFPAITNTSLTASRPVVSSAAKGIISGQIDLANANHITGTLPVGNGGVGGSAPASVGSFLVGNGTIYQPTPLATYNGISSTNTSGTRFDLSLTGVVSIAGINLSNTVNANSLSVSNWINGKTQTNTSPSISTAPYTSFGSTNILFAPTNAADGKPMISDAQGNARWLSLDLANVNSVTGILPFNNGGTGTGATPTSGKILIGNGSVYQVTPINAFNAIGITNVPGTGLDFGLNYASGWGVHLLIVSGALTANATNTLTLMPTNAVTFQADFTGGTPMVQTADFMRTNVTIYLTNPVVGRTMVFCLRGDANAVDRTVTFATNGLIGHWPIHWGFNTPTNGATAFTVTNNIGAELSVLVKSNAFSAFWGPQR